MQLGFTLIKRKATPLIQVAMCLVLGWVGMAGIHFLHVANAAEYYVAYVAIIFYCIMNTVISISAASFLRYTIPSWYLYILLVVLLLLSAKFLSGISIWDLWEFRMMLLSITIFYFVVSTMVRAIRFIYEVAESGE